MKCIENVTVLLGKDIDAISQVREALAKTKGQGGTGTEENKAALSEMARNGKVAAHVVDQLLEPSRDSGSDSL